MKISHRLTALAALSAAGLLCVAGVSYWSVTSIQDDLEGLTLKAAPLQARTLELQERTERALSALLRLSHARSGDEVDKAIAAATSDLQAMDRLRGEIRALDPSARTENADFRAAQEQIARAAQQRLADDAGYRQEAEAARLALGKAEAAIGATRSAVARIGVEAGQAADKAQEAVRHLGAATRQALLAQNRLKEVLLVVAEVDAVSNRFRLAPLKERVKAPLDSIQRLEVEAGAEDHLKDARASAARLWDLVARDGDGLLALRTKVLAKQDGAEAAYQAQRKAVLTTVDEQSLKLGSLVDTVDVQAVKQRQVLEAALKLRNEPGGVVTTSEEIALAIRDMVGGLRLLMLADREADAAATGTALRSQGAKLVQSMQSMRGGLQRMGRQPLVRQVDEALAAMASVGGTVDKVTQTKQRLLASEATMAQSLAQLKAVAAQQAALGERQVRSVSERQAQVTEAVDRRVKSSIALVLGIAAGVAVLVAVIGWHVVRSVTRSLTSAIEVAEQVSHGRLVDVRADASRDETARLMRALAKMVGTLRGIVGEIQHSAAQIDAGSRELSRGNHDLSQRTEAQAAQLQQTAASVDELAATVGQNAESARAANDLAAQARDVAGRGGAMVGDVVATMSGIQDASRRIAEIIGVIDGIAFQTNILALNAAVEAARAGEHGRGFAVVAAEVRALAGKCAEAAHQVKDIVQASVERIDAGSQQVRDAGQTMHGIVEQVHRVGELVSQIATASGQQAGAVASVNEAVTQIDQMTQHNAALAEQGSAAAGSLRAQAEALLHAVSVFSREESTAA